MSAEGRDRRERKRAQVNHNYTVKREEKKFTHTWFDKKIVYSVICRRFMIDIYTYLAEAEIIIIMSIHVEIYIFVTQKKFLTTY